MQNNRYSSKFLLTAGVLALATLPLGGMLEARELSPSLIITQDDLPPGLREKIYSRPSQVRDIRPAEVLPPNAIVQGETLVGRKIQEISTDLFSLQGDISSLGARLSRLEGTARSIALEYYTNVANISTQLQSGTTPGNPRLVRKIGNAENNVESLSANIAGLNELAIDTAHISSEASFLLEETRASYNISGAFEEDHVNLAKMEDSINGTIVLIERILNNVNDDIMRTSAYLSSERQNLRTLALAVANGDLYGKNLAVRPFSSAPAYSAAASAPQDMSALSSMPAIAPTAVVAEQLSPLSPRPLAKIRFDKQNVDYEQPVYMAVSKALEKYPNSKFDLIAVHPSGGNAAQKAIESTRSRRNAERVLRTLTQMGLPLERISLSYNESDTAQGNEVHLYIR